MGGCVIPSASPWGYHTAPRELSLRISSGGCVETRPGTPRGRALIGHEGRRKSSSVGNGANKASPPATSALGSTGRHASTSGTAAATDRNRRSAVEDLPKEPYPIDDDPRFLVSWYERGKDLLGPVERRWADLDESEDAFQDFTMAAVEEFKHGVENDSWRLLWFGNRGAGERSAQVLFRSVVRHYCQANDVDITGESNAGRGPVDFKFSKGWKSRALIEIKLARHSAFWEGILAQTPTYQVAEGVKTAIFVAIAYSESEMSLEFQAKLRQAASLVSEQKKIRVRAVLVDATQKVSGSKARDPELKAMLDELQRDAEMEGDAESSELPPS